VGDGMTVDAGVDDDYMGNAQLNWRRLKNTRAVAM